MTPPAGILTPDDHRRICARVAQRLGPERADPRALATVVAELRSWAAAAFVGAKAFAAQDALDTELVREAASLGCAVPRRKLVRARPLPEPLRSETWAQGARAVNQPFNCGLGSSLSFVRAGVMVLSEVMASC